MEDQIDVSRPAERAGEPDRPLREPAPIHRPVVDSSAAARFSRPDGVSGGLDPRHRTGSDDAAPSLTPGDPDPALAQAFGPSPGAEHGIERHPSWQDEAELPPPPPPDPWRDPYAPVGFGAPAVSPTSETPPEDLSGAGVPAASRLSLSEVLFERRLSRRALAAAAAAVAVVALVGGGIGAVVADTAHVLTTSTVRIADAPEDVIRPDNPVGEVARRVQPAVVNIRVSTPSARGEGSGIVIDPKGYIVTNNHVVTMDGAADRADIDVVFPDGSRVSAELVGRDPATDLAVLKVEDVANLTVATLGDSDRVEVGERVVAIGSPLGLARTVTEGIVSATGRPIALGESTSDGDVVIDAIQTDAAINPGNSGGPLIDASGAVIGINTSIFTQSGGSIGLGFAIPVNDVRAIATSLMTEGSVRHATIGVNARKADNGNVEGAELVNVREGSPAQAAGLREGDVVTQVGERRVRSSDELIVAVRRAGADADVPVEVIRNGAQIDLTVRPTLG
ncbi:S1C family serine protease [Rhodococcus sp. IEGM 1408]|uniref:S1C family serine protease n=1 Tax=Rhodococcus sp. IEGM 1408 TaxID=3082220 RepID=UPI0029530684|nr:trypsin-like peptidase domain-containing protein [Rhodococcus sp. IEGM 1408]MDV8000591.1 trypsin-like peptidase domain-containing protein [Rhodococcus sp. IEGM 1408]